MIQPFDLDEPGVEQEQDQYHILVAVMDTDHGAYVDVVVEELEDGLLMLPMPKERDLALIIPTVPSITAKQLQDQIQQRIVVVVVSLHVFGKSSNGFLFPKFPLRWRL
ncbi:MAG: hypothetical protein EZS28_021066 [Streblomastix strix]|uniref:Uncharacterized protein n=1 Tax=Streblomastix strix TaxID=222440 RepID=A0A5J4VL89_9EUKA|nr:MAG: hypothetical protein EZS28_021066 [Streblomastix strix]